MTKLQLDELLSDPLDTDVKVHARLHQNIMRAVRQAQPGSNVARHDWYLPAWGFGLVSTFVAVFYLSLAPGPDISGESFKRLQGQQRSGQSLALLGDALNSLPKELAGPEDELRKELERLKSDLGRFGFDT